MVNVCDRINGTLHRALKLFKNINNTERNYVGVLESVVAGDMWSHVVGKTRDKLEENHRPWKCDSSI